MSWKKILRDKIERLKIETLLRNEDDTVAFYMPLEDKVHIFIDAWCSNTYELWRYCRRTLKLKYPLEEFLIFNMNKTYLHELLHWAGEEEVDDYMADRMAVNLSFPKPLLFIYIAHLTLRKRKKKGKRKRERRKANT